MKRIAEYDFGAETLELLRGHRLDRAIGPDRHESRSLKGAVPRLHPTATRSPVFGKTLECQAQEGILAGRNMASP